MYIVASNICEVRRFASATAAVNFATKLAAVGHVDIIVIRDGMSSMYNIMLIGL
jgi:hypothetical protein